MIREFILNIFLIIYFFTVIFENLSYSDSISISAIRRNLNKLNIGKILPFLLAPISIFGLLFIKGDRNFISIYIYTALGSLVILHAAWISRYSKLSKKIILITISIIIIIARIYQPNQITHDIFIFFSVVWLGPFVATIKSFTAKYFSVISIIWFLYDIIYIWLTGLSQQVENISNQAGFPFAFTVNKTSIGLADLFYASVLISIIKTKKYKILAGALLITTNVLLTIIVYKIHYLSVFPLLVLWVPCGLFVLLVERKIRK
jgi:hypothetical protein